MKYLHGSFHVQMGGSEEYRSNWEQTFGRKTEEPKQNVKVWAHCRIDEHNLCQWPEVLAHAEKLGVKASLEPCPCDCHKPEGGGG